jgi:hypothetical protein
MTISPPSTPLAIHLIICARSLTQQNFGIPVENGRDKPFLAISTEYVFAHGQ